jgi:hypothetical protein
MSKQLLSVLLPLNRKYAKEEIVIVKNKGIKTNALKIEKPNCLLLLFPLVISKL